MYGTIHSDLAIGGQTTNNYSKYFTIIHYAAGG